MNRLQIGDEVVVTAGSHKGNRGKVARLTNNGRVVVEGVNRVKRHMKASPQQPGGILEIEAPIHASNVMLIDPETDKATRIRFETQDDNKVRVATKSGKVVPVPRAEASNE